MGLRVCYFAVGAIAAAIAAGHVRAEDRVIKIGGLLPMSGPGSYFGAQGRPRRPSGCWTNTNPTS